MTIAKKHAQSYMPNGEVSLESLIQAAIDEAVAAYVNYPEYRDKNELQERIRQMEAERVPLGILDSMINLVEGFPVIDWRNSKTGMRIKDSSAWVEFYCAAKNAIAAASAQEKA